MIDRRIPPCYDCGAWDDEREGCTMPAFDRQYACPLENEEKDEELIRKSDVLDLLNQNYYRFRDTDYEIYSDLFDGINNLLPINLDECHGMNRAKQFILEQIKLLPSTEKVTRTGTWFGTVCSACGESTSFYYDCDYCPHCGAKMRGV